VQARMWFNLAAAQGVKQAAEARDRLAPKMSSVQIEEAQRLAREWKPKKWRGILFVFVIVILSVSPGFADFSGRVVGVSDGDTIKVLHNGRAEKIRLQAVHVVIPPALVLAEAAEGAGVLKDRLTPAMQAGVADYVRRQSWQWYGLTSQVRNMN
jgi:hypothetical protein